MQNWFPMSIYYFKYKQSSLVHYKNSYTSTGDYTYVVYKGLTSVMEVSNGLM